MEEMQMITFHSYLRTYKTKVDHGSKMDLVLFKKIYSMNYKFKLVTILNCYTSALCES